MYKRYYDGYGPYSPVVAEADGEVIIPESDSDTDSRSNEDNAKAEECSAPTESTSIASITSCNPSNRGGLGKFIDSIEIDDIILLGVILLVLKDSADDSLLVIILAIIFLSGLTDKNDKCC